MTDHDPPGPPGDGRPDDAYTAWQQWHESRTDTVSGPYGPLALTATHWLAGRPDGRIPDVPGDWQPDGDAVRLTAGPGDGLTLDGRPFQGTVRLGTEDRPPAEARLGHGARHLVLLRREGEWAVRVFDPHAPARRAFRGIEATPHRKDWVLSGTFRPYPEPRTVQVDNADGRRRGLGLGGEVAFGHDGARHALQVAVDPRTGGLWAVFGDATGGATSYRFRFLKPPAPAPDGSVTLDFNRAQLPPCAFADQFICPFPPPGNTLPFPVDAGERRLKGTLAG
ncbi:DUF1684 domain-containing protein [Streptomyces bambusae]|uniref:DUF1684 domain-containing protein n=1 Tax=Streptomyces bambusae TaxID=1550616 RepID=UPI001CFDF19D|nr:DUF1684 domain-containing protein [Streptomyces bambusae]MCB5167099.1 DUF1684 domain-containing protein [Streptomyces bambusae]